MALTEREELEFLELKAKETKPKPEPKSSPTLIERGKKVAEETGLGAVAGYFAPELTQAAGALSMAGGVAFPLAAPVLEPLGLGLTATGRAMRMVRPAEALSGALAGGGGEIAAQTSEAAGQGKTAQEAWRLAGGVVTPAIKGMIGWGAKKAIASVTGMVTKADLNAVSRAITDALNVPEQSLSQAQKQYIRQVSQQIVSGTAPEASEIFYRNLEAGTQQIVFDYNQRSGLLEQEANYLTQFAEKAAKDKTIEAQAIVDKLFAQFNQTAEKLRQTAEARAQAILANSKVQSSKFPNAKDADGVIKMAKMEADAIRNEASERILRLQKLADKARVSGTVRKESAIKKLASVGEAKLPTETGEIIRSRVMPIYERLKTKRSENAETLKSDAFNIGRIKESSGQFARDTTAYKSAMAKLEEKINTTTLDVLRTPLLKIKAALQPVIKDPETGEIMMGSPTKLESLEQIRRFLRDRSYGLPAEGFEAIDQQASGELADMVEKIQIEFSPGIETFLNKYKTDSEPLRAFKDRLGKALVGKEEFDMSRLKTDAANLGNMFFKTKGSAQELIEFIGGDKGEAEKIARGWIADQLQNETTAKGIRSRIYNYRDFLSVFPELKSQLEHAADSLELAEKLLPKRSKLADTLRTEIGKVRSGVEPALASRASKATTSAEETISAAEKPIRTQAGQILSRAEQAGKEGISQASTAASSKLAEAKTLSAEAKRIEQQILGKTFAQKRIREILDSGNFELWSEIAPMLVDNPDFKRSLADTIRQRLGDIAVSKPNSLMKYFKENIKDAILITEAMTPKELAQLTEQLERINITLEPAKKVGAIQRAITNAFSAAAAGTGGKAIDIIRGAFPSIPAKPADEE